MIGFDLAIDGAVSRNHAVIRIVPGDPPVFTLADLNSRNGTFVNGRKVTGEVELLPDDQVELGADGPKFVFDVKPRPDHLGERTRLVLPSKPASRFSPLETAAAAPAEPSWLANQGAAPVKAPLLARNRSWLVTPALLAGIVLMIAAIAAGYYWWGASAGPAPGHAIAAANPRPAEPIPAPAPAAADPNRDAAEKTGPATGGAFQASVLNRPAPAAPEPEIEGRDIAARGAAATVRIETRWTRYSTASNRPVKQKLVHCREGSLPAYVKLADSSVPWLTTHGDGSKISGETFGTGFILIVGDSGLLVTDDSTAFPSPPPSAAGGGVGKAVVVQEIASTQHKPREDERHLCSHMTRQPAGLDPATATVLFDPRVPMREEVAYGIEARYEYQARLLDRRLNLPLSPSRVPQGGVLFQISQPTPIGGLQVASDGAAAAGQRVFVLAYPAALSVASPPAIAVAEISRGASASEYGQPTPIRATIVDAGADIYRLGDVPRGVTSGGPIFDTKGRLIALFTVDPEGKPLGIPIRFVTEFARKMAAAMPLEAK